MMGPVRTQAGTSKSHHNAGKSYQTVEAVKVLHVYAKPVKDKLQ